MTELARPVRRVETAKGHYYRDANGVSVPGVTTIIGEGVPKPALISWAGSSTAEYAVDHWDELAEMPPAQRLKVLRGSRYAEKDRAARRGTEVHKAAEKLVAGYPAQVADELAGHVEAYARFLEDFDVRPVHVEFPAVSYRWGYAGTADLCADLTLPGHALPVRMLLDLKTARSGIYGETALQLAAYRYADKWLTGEGREIDPPSVTYCAGIHVRSDGYDLIPVEADVEQHMAFLHAMRVGQWAQTSRDLIGSPIVPPTTSTYRMTRAEDQIL